MPATILPCGCPCTNLENPCDCCPCITNVKIYSNIDFVITGAGNYANIVAGGSAQRPINYQFNYTISINSLISIPNSNFSGEIACASCAGAGFSGNASNGFLDCELDYTQTWELAAGVECPSGVGGCRGYSGPPLIEGGCPMDVCKEYGQILHISSNPGGGETDLQYSNCNYVDIPGEGPEDHINEYFCSDDRGPYPNNPSALYGALVICPSTSLFNLSLEFGDQTDPYNYFVLGTSPVNGTFLGFALINNSQTQTPLYLSYNGPQGLISKSISGSANIAIEFDYAVRNPQTNQCPQV
jgi:hypothetical protein